MSRVSNQPVFQLLTLPSGPWLGAAALVYAHYMPCGICGRLARAVGSAILAIEGTGMSNLIQIEIERDVADAAAGRASQEGLTVAPALTVDMIHKISEAWKIPD
jgi:hypothetical protein